MVLRGIPYNNSIHITMFNGTLNVDEKYIVLLADAAMTASVYTLSSRNSVYGYAKADELPDSLLDMLADAENFVTVPHIKSEEELLAEELAVMQG